MSEHTPGPWRWENWHMPIHRLNEGEPDTLAVTPKPPLEMEELGIKEIAIIRLAAPLKNAADAYLIAAAPDLYAAVDAALSWLIHEELSGAGFEYDGEPPGNPREILRAALAKAEGRPWPPEESDGD